VLDKRIQAGDDTLEVVSSLLIDKNQHQGNILKPVSSFAMKIHGLIWPDRACDPRQEDVIERSYPYFDGIWTGDRAESWYLEALAVHPEYHGRGVGRALVRWGLDRAELDGVCASVVSARGKDEFYRKSGFELQDGSAGAGEGNPLANVEGGNIWWKLPKAEN
jgi:ribosomal protein S18 acetylase RimI-like enzyme